MSIWLLFSLQILRAIYTIQAAELPSFIKACKNDTSTIQECILSQAPTVVAKLMKGNKEVGYAPLEIPPLDPLELEHLDISVSDDFTLKMKKMRIDGLGTANITRAVIDPKKHEIQLSMNFKKVTLTCVYILKGFVFILSVNSQGPAKLEFEDITLHVKFAMKVDNRNDVLYYQAPRNFDMGFSFNNVSLNFDNLFPKDPQLEKILNKFVNDNFEDLYQGLKPGILDAVRRVIHDLALKFVANIPINKLFIQ